MRPLCPRCRPVASAATADAPVGSGTRDRRGALLSFLIPGLGQMARGDAPRGVAILALTVVIAILTQGHPRLAPFFVCFWIYQVLDAYFLAASPPEAAANRLEGRRWSPRLVGLGLLFSVLTLGSEHMPRPQVLVPALLIAAGLRLLYTYFRVQENA